MNNACLQGAFFGRLLYGLFPLLVVLLSGCLPKQPMVDIRAAENIRQVSDGRVFVTGRDALYQVLQVDDGSYQKRSVYPNALPGLDGSASAEDSCAYYAGLAELNGWLFFVCAQPSGLDLRDLKFNRAGLLQAYSLSEQRVVTVMALADYQFPNGLDALASEDAILIADEDFFLARGGISKARFDFSSGEPVLTDYHYQWIGPDQQVFAANGVRVWNDAVYLTDIGFFKRVEIQADGTPAQAENLYKNLTVLDDFDVFCDGFLITDYVKGRLVYVSLDGADPIPTAGGLDSPSGLLGHPKPPFADGTIWVTESGGLQSGGGNQLVRIEVSQLGLAGCVE